MPFVGQLLGRLIKKNNNRIDSYAKKHKNRSG